MYQKQLYKDNRLTSLALRNIGFQEAHSSSLPKSLYEINIKHTQSCWRDALNISLESFYKLQSLLIDAGTQNKWKFYNIIICSAQDRISSATHSQLKNSVMSKRPNWKVSHFETIFIALQMNKSQQFHEICMFGGQNWTVYQSSFQTIGQCLSLIFDKLSRGDKKASLMDSEVDQYNFALKKQEYMGIGLCIDSSAKMGDKWQNIINKLGFSMTKLSQNDILLGIVFNRKPWVVAKQSKQQFQLTLQSKPIIHQNPYVVPQQQNPIPQYQNPQNIPNYQNPPVVPQYQQNPQRNNQNQNNYVQLPVYRAPEPARNNGCAKCCCYIITFLLISFIIRLIAYGVASRS